MLAQLQKSWEGRRGAADPHIWRAEAQRLKRLRDELNGYVERLHCRHANGISIYEAIGRVIDGIDVPALGFSWSSGKTHDLAAMEAMRDVVDRLDVNVQAIEQGALRDHPMAAIGQGDWSPSWAQHLVAAARDVMPVAQAVESAYERFAQAAGLPRTPLNRRVRAALAVLARTLP